MLFFLWPATVFFIMSTSKNHTIRYVLMIFPALSIIVAKTLYDCLNTSWKERFLNALAGIACLTALFVNSTPFQVKVTLNESSKEVRHLASIIKLNTFENEKIGNFKLSHWNPKHAMFFYSDRELENPITDKKELLKQSEKIPNKMWLTNATEFKILNSQAPNSFYLIMGNSKYAFFTSSKNRNLIKYDFSEMKLPDIK